MISDLRRPSCKNPVRRAGWFFIVFLIVSAVSAYSQDTQGDTDLVPLDESQFDDNRNKSGSQAGGSDYDEETFSEEEGGIPTAVIEGVQVSGEPGEKPNEKVISCYFIFRDKPSSYFYDVRLKEKNLVFEFNDTRTSGAPVPSVAEPPIIGFTVEDRKVNVNKEIKGLRPEYHNQIRVVFNLTDVPDIRVSDEYNVISFSYKWTTDSAKLADYIIKPPPVWPWWTGGSIGTAGIAFAVWRIWIYEPPPTPIDELRIDDLPIHIHQ